MHDQWADKFQKTDVGGDFRVVSSPGGMFNTPLYLRPAKREAMATGWADIAKQIVEQDDKTLWERNQRAAALIDSWAADTSGYDEYAMAKLNSAASPPERESSLLTEEERKEVVSLMVDACKSSLTTECRLNGMARALSVLLERFDVRRRGSDNAKEGG